MKLNLPQLKQRLESNGVEKLYMISGDEFFLLNEVSGQLLNFISANGFSDPLKFSADSSFNWSQLDHARQSLSLFGDKQCILIRLNSWKLSAAGKESLARYVDSNNDNYTLIVSGPKIESATSKTKWFSQLEKATIHIAVWPIASQQLPAWIMKQAKHYQLTLTTRQAQLIAQHSEGNLLATDQELQKLKLLGSEFTDADIESVISDNAQYDIFQLVDCCLGGNIQHAKKMFTSLKQQAAEPILIQWALARELRKMAEIIDRVNQGDTLTSLAKNFQIWEKRLTPVKHFIRHFDQHFCFKQLSQLAKADQQIKGITPGDPWQTLLEVILATAGAKIHVG